MPAFAVCGSLARSQCASLGLEGSQLHSAALGRGQQPRLGEPYATRPRGEVVRERRVLKHMPDEQLPLDLEAVVELAVVGNLLPLAAEGLGGRNIGVPLRLGRGTAVLGAAVAQARDRAALGAIDLELQQLVAGDTDAP